MRRVIGWCTLVLMILGGAVAADDPPVRGEASNQPVPALDLIEFLGSFDEQDGDLGEFLATSPKTPAGAAPAVDLIEYLGSFDAEDSAWVDFLTSHSPVPAPSAGKDSGHRAPLP